MPAGAEPANGLRRAGATAPRALLAGLVAAVAAAACGDAPTAPAADGLELVAASPTVQFAPPSTATPEPLRVQVRRRSDLAPREDVEVAWSLVEGSGAVLGPFVGATDSAGIASAALTLGPAHGRYRVLASLVEGDAEPVEFEVWAVEAPVLSGLPSSPVAPGSTVLLEGSNFSPIAAHDVVLFGGVRARVIEATATSLRVEVPMCLPAATLPVTVSLGSVASASGYVRVSGGGQVEALPVGGSMELDGGAATACVRLPAGARYVAVLRSASTVAGARYPVRVRSLVRGGTVALSSVAALVPRAATVPTGWRGPADLGSEPGSMPALDAQGAWDHELRLREQHLVASRAAHPPRTSPGAAPAAVPEVGEERTFHVLSGGGFVDVRATVRHVGREVALFEDATTPEGALRPEDYAILARRFDDLIHPVVTNAFGRIPDLDGNERVAVLLTPVVNRLTPPGGDGFVGGFFYGLDLLEGRTGSNHGEVFYALVPDPAGAFGDPRPRDLVMASLPAILAHELQHMIHFNERVLELDAAGAEATWLSEGLAQMAEDLVGREAHARADEAQAQLFESGNHERARRFLGAAPRTSLIISSGGGSLAERGASWLFVRYLEERYGGVAVLRSLTKSRLTSTANVAAVTGEGWAELLGTWGVALFDGSGAGVSDPLLADPRHRYATLRPRQDLVAAGEPYPLVPAALGHLDATLLLDVLPAAPVHFIVEAPAGASVTLALGRADGGATSTSAGVYLRIVRLR